LSERAKIRVAIIFGGRSAEHEISILSARNMLEALDRSRFEPVLIGIDKTGRSTRRPHCNRRVALDPVAD
jgi:D-alanine-D-alanine ligase